MGRNVLYWQNSGKICFFLTGLTYKRTQNPKENWSHNTSSRAYSWIPSFYKHEELQAHVLIGETLGYKLTGNNIF